jgi:hypothetical protein
MKKKRRKRGRGRKERGRRKRWVDEPLTFDSGFATTRVSKCECRSRS